MQTRLSVKQLLLKQLTAVLMAIVFILSVVPAVRVSAAGDYSAENNNFLLSYNSENFEVSVLDKRTNHVWTSYIDGSTLPGRPANKMWSNRIKTLLEIYYVKSDSVNGDVNSTNLFDETCVVEPTKITDGFSLLIDFTKTQLKLRVDFTIDESGMTVLIPEDGLDEYGGNMLSSVSVLPFFGYSFDSDDGYYLIPNGSGELYLFRDETFRSAALKDYGFNIYSQSFPHVRSLFNDWALTLNLPVFGVKKGDSGFLAIIEKGEANSTVSIAPSGVSVTCNRIFANFSYRFQHDVEGSNISIKGSRGYYPLATIFDKDYIREDRQIKFSFLADEKANYSGMAEAARDNFIERGFIKDKKNDETMPVLLDYFMGINAKKLIFDVFVPMTKFDEAIDMSQYLKDNGVTNQIVNLQGWEKNGYMSKGALSSPSGKLGGKSGLKKLSEFISKNEMKLYLESDVMWMDDKTKASVSGEAAKDSDKFVLQSTIYAGNTSYEMRLFNPAVAKTRNDKMIKTIDKTYNVDGIIYKGLGTVVYNDYTTKNPFTRSETADAWSSLLKASKDTFGSAGVIGSNLYTLENADFVKEVPVKGKSFLLGDVTVPFYQMVIHGYIYYSGDPINLYYDKTDQFLKLIEYGYVPYYQLTHKPSTDMRDTLYNDLFTSQFDKWKDDIVVSYNKLNDTLEDTWNEIMVSHDEVMPKLYKIVYESGTTIYVNYNEKDVTHDNIIIPAKDYKVIKAGVK